MEECNINTTELQLLQISNVSGHNKNDTVQLNETQKRSKMLKMKKKVSGCVLKGHSYQESYIHSTHEPTPPSCGVLQVMLTGGMAIWQVYAAKRK